jgi:hypothetical protein
MKKTKITTALIGAIAIASTAQAQYQLNDVIRDGVVGGVIGGVIGNNVGEGDSETGALIGVVSGITGGVINRQGTSVHAPRGGHHSHAPRRTHNVINCTRTITYYESVWVKPIYNYDVYGNPFVIREGHWKQIRRSRIAPCSGCGSCR